MNTTRATQDVIRDFVAAVEQAAQAFKERAMLDPESIREFGDPNDPYLQWSDGFMTSHQALRALCMELGELESELEPLTSQREALRARIGDIVGREDGPVEIRGFGVVRITAPSVTKGYDKAAIKALIDELAEDHPAIAEKLAGCETKSMRAGGLRIERERE
jgi:hypothetical protein